MEETMDVETLLTLPYELQVETLIHVPYYDLLRFCTISTAAQRICNDDLFWKHKMEHDFGNRYPNTIHVRPLPGDTWKQKYKSYFVGMGFDLVIAVLKNNDADVEDILSFGINPHLYEKIDEALILASGLGYTSIVQTLLNAEADPNSATDSTDAADTTALSHASFSGYVDIVQLLLEYGANVDMQDHMGRTALILASIQGHIEMVQFLLDSGADVNLKSDDGTDALISAAGGGYIPPGGGYAAAGDGHTDVVRLLLASGANPYVKTNTGHTALRFAEVVTGPTSEMSYMLRRSLRYPFTIM